MRALIVMINILHWSKNRTLRITFGFLFISIAIYCLWLISSASTASTASTTENTSFYAIRALPEKIELDVEKVALGKSLFHDPRLSLNNTVSCASCHNLSTGGVDGLSRSVGINAGVSAVNTPTVFNSGFNFVQFWDGRAISLEDQIEGPLNHPKEMGSNWKQVVGKLSQDKFSLNQFIKFYPDGITPTNIKDAIATFERSLITPNSRFDKFLNGEINAINQQEKHGYELFQSYGCTSCHQGMNIGGNMYEKMGLMGNYFADRGNLTEADNGRFNLNHDSNSLHEFRVPSLRNVALTAPYFHDGYAKTLDDAVAIMAKYQLGRPMPKDDMDAIVAYLKTLTGEYEGKPL